MDVNQKERVGNQKERVGNQKERIGNQKERVGNQKERVGNQKNPNKILIFLNKNLKKVSRFKKIFNTIKMKKYTSNYAKNKDINDKYVSSDTNSKDMKSIPISNQNIGNYFKYKDYDDESSFQIKLSATPDIPEGSKPIYKKR